MSVCFPRLHDTANSELMYHTMISHQLTNIFSAHQISVPHMLMHMFLKSCWVLSDIDWLYVLYCDKIGTFY